MGIIVNWGRSKLMKREKSAERRPSSREESEIQREKFKREQIGEN